MGEKTFSDEQLAAINTRDRTLLVSAAAGSGKTTTLTERIIRSILDGENPESLSDMLIVTFTKAAVADMREKIAKELSRAVSANPENKRLEKELFLLPSAKICTIDSFTGEILRANAERVGVPPNYRIAEGAEAAILASSIMANLIDAAFEGDISEVCSPEDFEYLCDGLTSSKSTASLSEVFLLLYKKSESSIEGASLYSRLAELYSEGDRFKVEETKFGKEVMDKTHEMLKFYTGLAEKLSTELMGGTEAEERDSLTFANDAAALKPLIDIKSYTAMREAIGLISFPSFDGAKDEEKTPFLLFAREERDALKAEIAQYAKNFFSYTEEEWISLYAHLNKTVSTLGAFLELFDKRFTREKIRRGMLEYADVTRFARKCLYREDGGRTDIAEAYSKLFTSIYIDEYQDVNALQDSVFEALASDKNRFMVGDIKQSIYRFRSAKPDLFAKKKEQLPELEKSSPESGASIFMSRNYRCDEGIIDFVNEIFTFIFPIAAKNIGYEKKDRLQYSKIYPDGVKEQKIPAKVVLIEPTKKNAEYESIITSEEYIANEIARLLKEEHLADGSPISPSDIAIITRKNAPMAKYAEALEKRNIKSEAKDLRSFFLNAEVLLALSLLNAIDNPKKDIYLAALLASPLYGFSADELVKIRKSSEAEDLYTAALEYSEAHPEYKKLSDFIKKLSHYRLLSEGMNVDALISRLYRETGLLSLASKHGGRENLLALYNYARKYEGSSFKGLYNFINYINRVIEAGASIEAEGADEGDDSAVKIISAHSSKGLEFPIVFFAEAASRFTNLDTRGRIAYAEDYGISLTLRTPGGLGIARNPIMHLIHEKQDEKFLEEEASVLYVILTRARERLYVVGKSPTPDAEEYLELTDFRKQTTNGYSVKRLTSFLDMIAVAKPKSAVFEIISQTEKEQCDSEGDKAESSVDSEKAPEKEKEPTLSEEKIKEISDELYSRFTYSYPDEAKTSIPEKLSVSRLYPAVLDGSEGEPDAPGIPKSEDRRAILPDFYTGSESDESALRGIATHTFLQFCRLDRLKAEGAKEELDHLISEKFLSPDNGKRVRIREIEAFTKSELFEKMLSANKIYRELRFNCRLPAEDFTLDEEKKRALSGTGILVQGVIDCIIIDGDGKITLIDYKTDRLTKEELCDLELAKAKLKEKHSTQLKYYSKAVEIIFGVAPDFVGIYSLPLGKTLKIL